MILHLKIKHNIVFILTIKDIVGMTCIKMK